jgi:hypothetical protein
VKKIVKTKFLCKNGSSVAPKTTSINDLSMIKWSDRFIEGKWYDGEYQTWSFEDGYRINGGWRRYWVINEQGKKEEISKAEFKAIFETDIQNLRNEKIINILNNGEK